MSTNKQLLQAIKEVLAEKRPGLWANIRAKKLEVKNLIIKTLMQIKMQLRLVKRLIKKTLTLIH